MEETYNMKILRIKTSASRYGGNVYEEYMYRFLSDEMDVEETCPADVKQGTNRILSVVRFIFRLFQIASYQKASIQIRAMETALFLPKKPIKNIIIAHHVDHRYSSLLSASLQILTFYYLKWFRDRVAVLVTVSHYWKDFFESLGFQNVIVIYNPFDLNSFIRSSQEIEAFKLKYNLTKKPIIYIGNAQKKKGVDKAYEALKNIDAHIITSGKPQIKTDAINLDISYEEYITLLHASDVVLTMSQFKEGWNRTAHEAMLCKTPVIGSGLGGMSELLIGGKQLICQDFSELPEHISLCMKEKSIGENGYTYASQFTLELFENSWKSLLKDLDVRH